MKFCRADPGRIFVMRLENGEIVHETIEQFAREQGIVAAAVTVLGGATSGSRLVVGPADGDQRPVQPLFETLDGVHEVTGTGTLFPDEAGNPVLHLHMACGRNGRATVGCIRSGVKVWQVMEVIIRELTHTTARRRPDPQTGFEFLQP